MSDKDVVEQLNFFEKKVLKALHELKRASPEETLKKSGLSRLVEVMNASSWLQAKGLVKIDEVIRKTYSLRNPQVASRPLPERVAIEVLSKDHKGKGSMADLKKSGKLKDEEIAIALGWIRKKGWGEVTKHGTDTIITLTEKGAAAIHRKGEDELLIEKLAKTVIGEDDAKREIIEMLKQRKDIVNEKHIATRTVSLTDEGAKIAALDLKMKEEVAQLTPELIQSGRWRDVEVRRYDVKAFAPTIHGGRKHPLTVQLEKVRSIFLNMGFTEVTGQFVESAFWNMDVLFTAQDHPARELQDTFYIKNPERLDLSEDEALVEKVKQVHENGWKTGSLGWRYKWSRAEAERALLRTHTTVNSVRYIAKNPKPPFKVFCIGRIFRSEAMDSTHLPEFTQIEGIVCEKGANFDMLCGLLKEFYTRMGLPRIRIRPGYFPYTEPSLEVEIFWNGQWMELGGAGVFRPEVTAPLGVDEPVLAWGLGFERLAMLLWGLKDIRDIYISDVEWLKTMPQI
ncbi:MAG: phenylalanine--tRNA ligase subunit alpha [Thermoplasmata archaeon]